MQIRSVLAPNPSMMTRNGTNTYILGQGHVAVIDPGPASDAHLAAILAALLPTESVSHILVTHTHLDHSALARRLAAATGAVICGFGTAFAGRSDVMQALVGLHDLGGGEGQDMDFQPDLTLAHGDRLAADSWEVEALHTPGHIGNHLCFAAGDTLFSGDHVMGWSTSLISPPDGDMADYRAALQALASKPLSRFLPGHGYAIDRPAERLSELIAHRHARETAIVAALDAGAITCAAITEVVYRDLAAILRPAAQRNVLAHLIDLAGRNMVCADPFPGPDAIFWRG